MRLVVALVIGVATLTLRVLFAAPPTSGARWLGASEAGTQQGQMCGTGTFTVDLPGRQGSLPSGAFVPNDSVTLPNGCRIYALFVSGYSVNPMLDLLTFYKLTQFVATNNGYVHYAWWNNLMKEYLEGPLRAGAEYSPTPGGATNGLGFVPADFETAPKAIPEEDHQFQDDARRMLAAIRLHNPNAIVIVAGHSMGGNAVVRLGATTSTVIDLLAPIDPVGNRSDPVGRPPTLPLGHTYNWTRWRVANSLAGFRQVDCVRNALNLCRDFDPSPFRFEARCELGPILREPPLTGSRAPLLCPQPQPIVVTNPRPNIGENVRHFYHRWQNEFPFPFDFPQHHPIRRGGRPLTGLLGGNYQAPIERNLQSESDRTKSCGLFGSFSQTALALLALNPVFSPPVLDIAQPQDPNDSNLACSPYDGHGEVVGLRGALVPYGVRATGDGWPCYTEGRPLPDGCVADYPGARRQALLSLVSSTPPIPTKTILDPSTVRGWPWEPANPHLDLVVNDLLTIAQHLLDEVPATDTTAPVTAATTMPEPNAAGWHNEDVQLNLSAADAGTGVREIEYTLAGAQSQPTQTVAGGDVGVTLENEGTTTVSFLARDHSGNVESGRSLEVKLDKTPPSIQALTDTLPNANGWFNVPVTVSFAAWDLLSGLAQASSTPVTIGSEGAGQEVIGMATDVADNQSAASVSLNIDRTQPGVTTMSPPSGAVFLLNAASGASYQCSDVLSGVASCTGPVANGAAIDTSSPGPKVFVVNARDRADNTASVTHGYAVQYAFSGFGHPLQGAPPIAHEVQPGRIMPVKYSLRDAGGASIADSRSFVSLSSSMVSCNATSPGASAEPAASTGGGLRYDPALGQFVFNWNTRRDWAGTCRMLQLVLADGTSYLALFRFK